MGLHWLWQEWREPGTFLLRHLPPRVRAVIPHWYSHHTCTKTALCSAGVQGLELLPEPTLAWGMASCPSAAGHCRAGWMPSLLFLRSSACKGERKRRVVHSASRPGCSPGAAQNCTDSTDLPLRRGQPWHDTNQHCLSICNSIFLIKFPSHSRTRGSWHAWAAVCFIWGYPACCRLGF